MHQKKTQKTVIIILGVAIFLSLVGVGISYFISQTAEEDLTIPPDQHSYCGYILAYTTPECDSCACARIEEQALESRIGRIEDGVCTVDESELDDKVPEKDEEAEEDFIYDSDIGEGTEESELITCPIDNVRYSTCQCVSVRDTESEELLIPPISTESPILIQALFVPEPNEEFEEFHFTVNAENFSVDATDVQTETIGVEERYIPKIEFDDFERDNTLTVSADATSNLNPNIRQTDFTHKQYDLTREAVPSCSRAQVTMSADNTRIEEIELRTPNLDTAEDIQLEFSFDKAYEPFKMNNIPDEIQEILLINSSIVIEEEYLYPEEQYVDMYDNNQGFPELDSTLEEEPRMNIDLYVDDNLVDSSACYAYIDTQATDEIDEDVEDVEDVDEVDETEEDVTIEQPSFEVNITAPECIHPETEQVKFNAGISNLSENTQPISEITNKLPFGFSYEANSLQINDNNVDESILDIESIGESEEINLKDLDDWSIQPNSSLNLSYITNVEDSAEEGDSINEIVVTPENIPDDEDSLRNEFVIRIDEECEKLPDANIINLHKLTLLIGFIILIFGILIYKDRLNILNNAKLNKFYTNTIQSKINPKEYFEERTIDYTNPKKNNPKKNP